MVLLAAFTCAAKDDFTEKQAANRKVRDELNGTNQKTFAGKEDFLVLPGLVADKKTKTVTVLGETTDIAVNDIAEFYVIGEASGHDYESLAISFALPGDIIKALEFIGMKAGHPVSAQKMQFWPKGERVRMFFARHSDPKQLVPVEKFIMDDRTGKTLPEVGLAFTGSTVIRNAEGEEVLAADAREPQSVASVYNEPETVLDVPRQANQDALYDHLHTHDGMRFPKHELIDIVIRPEFTDGTERVCDLALKVEPPADRLDSITNYIYRIEGADGKLLNEEKDIRSVIDVFVKKNKASKDIYVSVSFADDVPAGRAAQVSQVVQSWETSGSIRVAPPIEGQLYYRAFIPNPAHLDRKGRSGHPWELRLRKKDDSVSGTLTQCEFDWKSGDVQNPAVKATDFEVTSSDDLRDTLKRNESERKAEGKRPNIPVILLVAPTDMPFRQIMDFITPSMDIIHVIHIYALDEE